MSEHPPEWEEIFKSIEDGGSRTSALRMAAAGGHAELLRVLHSIYGLDASDAREDSEALIFAASVNGHLDVLKVLHVFYGLAAGDATSETLKWAARNGHSDVLIVLKTIYGLGVADATSYNNYALVWRWQLPSMYLANALNAL